MYGDVLVGRFLNTNFRGNCILYEIIRKIFQSKVVQISSYLHYMLLVTALQVQFLCNSDDRVYDAAYCQCRNCAPSHILT